MRLLDDDEYRTSNIWLYCYVLSSEERLRPYLYIKIALMRLYSGRFLVSATLLLQTNFSYNHKDATDATAMNPKCSAHHTTVYTCSLYGRKFFDST